MECGEDISLVGGMRECDPIGGWNVGRDLIGRRNEGAQCFFYGSIYWGGGRGAHSQTPSL